MEIQEQPLECLFRLMRALRRGRSHHHGSHHFSWIWQTDGGDFPSEGTSARGIDRIIGYPAVVVERNAFRLESQGISGGSVMKKTPGFLISG